MENLVAALAILFTPGVLISCFAGCMVGVILGAIPGLSGAMAITILLPVSFTMEPTHAFALLISIWVGSCSGSYIGSILLGIPGTNSSLATTYDGYPMTKKGEATRALSIGTVANFMGTVPSLIIAMILCPVIAAFAVKMGPWEYFGLGLMAITLVVSISKGNMAKGFIGAGLGLLATQVGMAPISGTRRFTFDNIYLVGGFSMSVVMIGIFAGGMIIMNYANNEKGPASSFDGKLTGFRLQKEDFTSNIFNICRSFLIGAFIGFLPGMGAALSNMVSYAIAKNSSKHPEKFGTGIPDGIWAPEVANNASIGGAIIPMVSLGIPGDGTTAMLLGGLTIHGIEAGPLLQRTNPVLVNVIFLAAILGAIFALLAEVFGIRWFPMLLDVPYHYLYPAILVICMLGMYVDTYNISNVIIGLFFFALGIWMSYAGIPGTPFVLSYVLGAMLETNFRKALTFAKGDWTTFFTRPVSCILLIITVGSVVLPIVKEQLKKRKASKEAV
ncbi:MAG: tripartite tricarboxylate transporter permease [Faecalibacterium sp.]|nr:tripartite tricarboxylate transporter permease [Faecalibacterium sp.]